MAEISRGLLPLYLQVNLQAINRFKDSHLNFEIGSIFMSRRKEQWIFYFSVFGDIYFYDL